MSWEASFVKQGGTLLGASADVRNAIARAFPGIEWELAPGGEERLREMERYGAALSDEWRAMILATPPHWDGLFDAEPVTVEFDLSPAEPVRWVTITSRGDHDEAQRRLQALAGENGWVLKADDGG